MLDFTSKSDSDQIIFIFIFIFLTKVSFIVQTEGIISDGIIFRNVYHDLISVNQKNNYYLPLSNQFFIRKPPSVQWSNQPQGLVTLIYNLGDFLKAYPEKLTKSDPIYRLNVIQHKVQDPLIWTRRLHNLASYYRIANNMIVVGVLPNMREQMQNLLLLFLAPWICSFISSLLPSWNLYTLVATIIGVFLFTSNKGEGSIFYRELAFAVWLLFAVGFSHLISTNTSFKVPLYEAIANFIWTTIYYAYVEVGVIYLQQPKLDLTRKIATTMCLILVILTASTLLRDDVHCSVRKIIVIGRNVVYLIAAAIYLAISGRIFGITFREMFDSQRNIWISIEFAVKLCIAMLIRLTFQAAL